MGLKFDFLPTKALKVLGLGSKPSLVKQLLVNVSYSLIFLYIYIYMYISSFAPVKLFKLPRVEMELNSLFLVCVVHLLPVLTSHTLQTH